MKFNIVKGTDKKGDGYNSMEYILLHHTGGGSFKGNMDYLSENKAQVSIHYVVGDKGEIGKIGEDNYIMWHAGLGNQKYGDVMNNKAIGIEVVSDGKIFTVKQIMSLINLCIYLKELHNIPNSKIIRHKDFTSRKTDIGDNFYKVMNFKSFQQWKQGLLLPNNYRGVKLQLSSGRMGKEYNAFYDPKTDIINIQALYFTIKDKVKRDSVIFHEYCHHIFIKKVPKIYQKLWKNVYSFNPIIIKKLNKFLGTNFIENAFITEYAKTNYLEGFAECMEQNYLIDKGVDKKQYKGFLKIKLYIAKLIYNKFVDLDYKIK